MYRTEFILLNAAANIVKYASNPTTENFTSMIVTVDRVIRFAEDTDSKTGASGAFELVGIEESDNLTDEIACKIITNLAAYVIKQNEKTKNTIYFYIDALETLCNDGFPLPFTVTADFQELIKNLVEDYLEELD